MIVLQALWMLALTALLFGGAMVVCWSAMLLILGGHWRAHLLGFLLLWLEASVALYGASPDGKALIEAVITATIPGQPA